MEFSKLCDYYQLLQKAGFVNTSEQLAEGLDEEDVDEEDRKKVTSYPEIQFKDFVNCDHVTFKLQQE
jgi:hypothetical protein